MGRDANLRDGIVALARKRDYRGAHALVEEALGLRPADSFLLGYEVFLLLRLGRTAEARRKAEERLDSLGRDRFFLKTYADVLAKQGAAQDLEAFIERRLLGLGAAAGRQDEDVLVFSLRRAAGLLGRDRVAGLAARALALAPGSRALAALLDELRGREPPAGRGETCSCP